MPSKPAYPAFQTTGLCLSRPLEAAFQLTYPALLHHFDLPFQLPGPAVTPPAFPERLAYITPAGVLLQAHVIAAIMSQQQQQPSSLDIDAKQQASVLATALASATWQVCTNHCSLNARCVYMHVVNIFWKCQVLPYGFAESGINSMNTDLIHGYISLQSTPRNTSSTVHKQRM